MRSLDLSKKALGSVSAIFIGTMLNGNEHTNELVLHSNELRPAGVTFIVKRLLPSLKTLDLSNTVSNLQKETKADKKTDRKSATQSASTIPPEQVESLWAAVTSLESLEKLTMEYTCTYTYTYTCTCTCTYR